MLINILVWFFFYVHNKRLSIILYVTHIDRKLIYTFSIIFIENLLIFFLLFPVFNIVFCSVIIFSLYTIYSPSTRAKIFFLFYFILYFLLTRSTICIFYSFYNFTRYSLYCYWLFVHWSLVKYADVHCIIQLLVHEYETFIVFWPNDPNITKLRSWSRWREPAGKPKMVWHNIITMVSYNFNDILMVWTIITALHQCLYFIIICLNGYMYYKIYICPKFQNSSIVLHSLYIITESQHFSSIIRIFTRGWGPYLFRHREFNSRKKSDICLPVTIRSKGEGEANPGTLP